jgi:endoglucanase
VWLPLAVITALLVLAGLRLFAGADPGAASPAAGASAGQTRSTTPVAAAPTTPAPTVTPSASPSPTPRPVPSALFPDPHTNADDWLAANPTDPRAALIRARIASQPQAHWFTTVDLGTAQSGMSRYVEAANLAGQIPEVVIYGITDRDCGHYSAGGATTLAQYQNWIEALGAGLGDRRVIIILEPDAIAGQTCLSAADQTARDQALGTAVRILKADNPNAQVYLDGGNSNWNQPGDQVDRLLAAGIDRADGFFTNVSNFRPTGDEISYGRTLIALLDQAGVTGKHQVIDTSRNGGADGDWCGDDDSDRRLGRTPTVTTGVATVTAYLWVKHPGNADGCKYPAGSFQPVLAGSLASG